MRAKAFVGRLINEALSAPGVSDREVAAVVLRRLTAEDAASAYRRGMEEFISEREICSLFHFTRRENLKQILNSGLLPRRWLEKRPIQNALRPRFSDQQRWDGRKDANFLSVSFPNYRMFYAKASKKQHEWAVIEYQATLLKIYQAEFAPKNMSRRDAKSSFGLPGAQAMFCNWPLRRSLKLKRSYPTCPEAEVLVAKVLLPDMIKAIHFHPDARSSPLVTMTRKMNVKVVISERMFRPREDYQYWAQHHDFFLPSDYDLVRENEKVRTSWQ